MKKTSLSESREEVDDGYHPIEFVYPEFKVKQAVEDILEAWETVPDDDFPEAVQKIVGDKLIWKL